MDEDAVRDVVKKAVQEREEQQEEPETRAEGMKPNEGTLSMLEAMSGMFDTARHMRAIVGLYQAYFETAERWFENHFCHNLLPPRKRAEERMEIARWLMRDRQALVALAKRIRQVNDLKMSQEADRIIGEASDTDVKGQ